MKREALRYLYDSTSVSLAMRIGGVGLLFVAMVMLARVLSPAEFGLYAYVLEIVALGAVVTLLGFDQITVRVVPDCLAAGDSRGLFRFTAIGVAIAVVVSAVIVLGLAGAWWAGLIEAGLELRHIVLVAALLFALSLLRLGQEILRSAQRIVLSQVFEQVLWPLTLLIAAGAALAGLWRLDSPSVIALQVVVFGGGALLIFAIAGRVVPDNKAALPRQRGELSGWLAIGFPLALSAVFSVFLNRGDIIALGLVVPSAELAPYSAASRYSALLVLGQGAAAATTAALMRAYWRERDMASLQACVDRVAGLSVLLAAPLALLLIIAPRPFLSLYGSYYEDGADVLRVLAAAQLLNVAAGPVSLLAIVCDQQRIYTGLIAIASAVMALLLAIMTTRYGLLGASLATLIALAGFKLALAVVLRRRTGVRGWATLGAIVATCRDLWAAASRRTLAR